MAYQIKRKKIKTLEDRYLSDPVFRVAVDRIIEEQLEDHETIKDLENAIFLTYHFLDNPKRLNYLKTT